MFKIASSVFDNRGEIPSSKQFRLMVAIASLVVISLLTSAGGTPIQHSISNPWEGFIWGIAEPVIGLDKLAGVVVVGILSAILSSGIWITVAFVLAALFGQIIHLSALNILDTLVSITTVNIAIAICTIIFGSILILFQQKSWLICTILAVVAGLSQGYVDSQVIINVDVVTTLTYIVGVTLTQTVLILSAREISTKFSKKAVNQTINRSIRWVGLTFCAIGIVFLGNVLI
ncbi:MAG: hydantoin utilization protein [Nostocales cyanobacterium]|nr:MAG: hydantoin utilization protein [Nostocales cyanobacterium]TAF20696.1 MAG: hydantoin utilization protein [Nostocales cyanobacterium]